MAARNTQLLTKDPADLILHPLLKAMPDLPGWEKGGAKFEAFLRNVHEHGITTGLLITKDGYILSGRIRWRAAKQLQLAEVPVEITDEDAATVILREQTQRKHFPTLGALAYALYHAIQPAWEAFRRRRLANLAQNRRTTIESEIGEGTFESYVKSLGFSHDLIQQCKDVFARFAKHPDKRDITDKDGNRHCNVSFREFYGPRILSGEYGLGAVIAGIGGSIGSRVQKVHGQLELFEGGLSFVSKRFNYWTKFDEVTREKARATIRRTVAEMPEDLRDEFASAIREAHKTASQRRAA